VYERERARLPSRILAARARNRAWAEEHRSCQERNHWLAGAAPYSDHLPGGITTIQFEPRPRWPMHLRNARGLHGAITMLRDRPHGRWPAWSLFPCADGWAIYWSENADAERFANAHLNGALWDAPTLFRFGDLFRMRAPTDRKRGRRFVRIDAITPIVTRSVGGTAVCTCPTEDTIRGALTGELLYRLSPMHRGDAPGQDAWTQWTKPRVMLRMVERVTEPAHTDCGGKLGRVSGWQGSVTLETNATARWLLQACERGIGLGGRTAFGFGRIRVTSCE
jgi:hypothetical protein